MAKAKKNNTLKLLIICCSCICALVAFILLLATPAVKYEGYISVTINGTTGMFGGKQLLITYNGAWSGILAFIFVIVGFLGVAAIAVMALIKSKAKITKLIAFIAGGLLIAGGVLVFFEVATFNSANSLDGGALGAGWVIAAILAIVSGAGAICDELLF